MDQRNKRKTLRNRDELKELKKRLFDEVLYITYILKQNLIMDLKFQIMEGKVIFSLFLDPYKQELDQLGAIYLFIYLFIFYFIII